MLDMKPAPGKTVRAIRRRLAETTPAARLIRESVRHVPIPTTRYDAAVFIFELKGKFHFVAELCVPGLPHIFQKFEAETTDPRANLDNLLVSLESLRKTMAADPRFGGQVIHLNGAAR